jgi:hypothetical protein
MISGYPQSFVSQGPKYDPPTKPKKRRKKKKK